MRKIFFVVLVLLVAAVLLSACLKEYMFPDDPLVNPQPTIDLNEGQEFDLNHMMERCNYSCTAISYETWAVQLNQDTNRYSCLCTKEVCTGQTETETTVTKYCHDLKRRFYFD